MSWTSFGGAALLFLAIARLSFHAVFLPAYEGPDEPHHLGRIASFADDPLPVALRGAPLDGRITRAVELRPCGPGRLLCPPFGTAKGAFNLLHPFPAPADERRVPNPENHQPPLFYFVAGLLLRLLTRLDSTGWIAAPDVRLLSARAISIGLVTFALVFPLRRLLRDQPRHIAVLGLLALLLPGASEALIRCSNDAAVFCWAAFLLYALERRAPIAWICLLLAVGPLLKLTALPVDAFAIVQLWRRRLRSGALLGALSAAVVFPVQALRGWLWGGTYEFNRTLPGIHEPAFQIAQGVARSLYTVVKTVFWLGGWSFFRAPTILVVAWFLLIAAVLASSRVRSDAANLWSHAAGIALAIAGCLVFVVGNRRFYGVWGGVGGWYVWDWAPWLLIAFDDLLSVRIPLRPFLLSSIALFVAAANVVYFATAFRFYG